MARTTKSTVIGALMSYRTTLMEEARARSFAKCVSANKTRFGSVLVNRSGRARGDKAFYVSFAPTSLERQATLKDYQRLSRQEHALEAMEHGRLIFWQDIEKPKWLYWCFSVLSQETYIVSAHDCTCPDFECRGRSADIPCYHMAALALFKLAEGSLAPYDTHPVQAPKPVDHYHEEAPLTRAEMEEINALLNQRSGQDSE